MSKETSRYRSRRVACRRPSMTLVATTLATAVFWASASTGLRAQSCSHCSEATQAQPKQVRSAPAVNVPADVNAARSPMAAPHGGQITAGDRLYFEVVYAPKETRVYVYSPTQRPLDVRGVSGEVVLQVRGNPKPFRYPVKPVVSSAPDKALSYLAAVVDVSRVRDADMEVTFDLKNLPLRDEPAVRFTQTFALTRTAPAVRVVALSEADRAAVARQRVCPVMNTVLGDHGPPVKLLVGDQPLFLCCKGCIYGVKKDPETYLAKAAQMSRSR